MNTPKKILLGLLTVPFASLLVGIVPVQAQLSPSRLLLSAAPTTKPQMSAVDLYNRGVDQLDAGNYQGAIDNFTQALQLNPKDADAYYNRGYARHVLGKYQEAIADYTEAIRLKPDYGDAYGNRAYAQYLVGNLKEVIADCTAA